MGQPNTHKRRTQSNNPDNRTYGGFAFAKETKNIQDTKKIYRNAGRVINEAMFAARPRIFTALTIGNRINLESTAKLYSKKIY